MLGRIELMKNDFDNQRLTMLSDKLVGKGPIIYWMSRDQRVHDNWSLFYTVKTANDLGVSVAVIFSLVPEFLEATRRQYCFMLEGLKEVETELKKLGIPFYLLLGDPEVEVVNFAKEHGAGMVVTDFDPMKIKQNWQAEVGKKLTVPLMEVDAHNIVPCRMASNKQEFGAYTLRPKINHLLEQFLVTIPKIPKVAKIWPESSKGVDWEKASKSLKIDETVKEVSWLKSGEMAAKKAMRDFIEKRLSGYDEKRNDPNKEGQSELSPYLHFGQLSAQALAMAVKEAKVPKDDKEAFLEELIVRRELSDNYCLNNKHYDSVEGFASWAKESLKKHEGDKREYLYSLKEFEEVKTHDPLWNAAQKQMMIMGKMHGYMRMYWAKKILEWTKTPAEAMKIAIYLNDKYELDGRDPNGYAGISWSIGGTHDRAWFERAVFGKIRYMNYNGCKSKFDVEAYIHKINNLNP